MEQNPYNAVEKGTEKKEIRRKKKTKQIGTKTLK